MVSAFLLGMSRLGVDLSCVDAVVMVIVVIVVTVVVVGVVRFVAMWMLPRRVMHMLPFAVVMCGMMLVRDDLSCAEARDRRRDGTGPEPLIHLLKRPWIINPGDRASAAIANKICRAFHPIRLSPPTTGVKGIPSSTNTPNNRQSEAMSSGKGAGCLAKA